MVQRRPLPGEFYRHFKNKYYQIIGIAKHSETKEELVVYQALYDDFGMYVRPLAMFVSEVDHEKYPNVIQKYRFERVDATDIGKDIDTGYLNNDAVADNAPKVCEAFVSDEKSNVSMDIVDNVAVDNISAEDEVSGSDEEQPNPILMKFLDQDTYDEKLKYLNFVKQKLTDDVIDAMAASLDVTVPEGPIEARYASLKSCIATYARYECTRLR